MASNRYQHLRPRVKAKNAAFHSSVATKSKESKELEATKLLESWKNLSTPITSN